MRIPLVVIVGRPNVGKSTLFNRLTHSKDAIVDDFSGVTRDRNYGELDWNGIHFRVMDTGGYVPDSEDLFEIAIKEQVEIALDEADVVLFVTDGRTGSTPVDYEVAKMLRSSQKLSYLLVNKSDNVELGYNISDFYKLGINNIYDISALNGRNIGDLLDDVVEQLDLEPFDKAEDDRLKIAVLGRPNAGKSSLTNALLGYDRSIVTDIPGTTRDSLDSVLKYYGEEILLVDTAGLRKKARVHENIEFYSNVRTYRSIAECDVAVIMIDATLGLGKQDQTIIQEAVRRRKGIILAVNKWDLIEKDTHTAKKFEAELYEKLGSISYVPIMFISALTKQRVYKLIDLAKEIEQERKKRIATHDLNETILPELLKIVPPSTPTGKEVKVKYISMVGDKYPIFLMFSNEAKHIPDSYRRFVEKVIRREYGFRGVPMTVTFKEKNKSAEEE
ncbi:MAG: ribosome biogenesis GTPase Der [Rhodothermaceae bacterium]